MALGASTSSVILLLRLHMLVLFSDPRALGRHPLPRPHTTATAPPPPPPPGVRKRCDRQRSLSRFCFPTRSDATTNQEPPVAPGHAGHRDRLVTARGTSVAPTSSGLRDFQPRGEFPRNVAGKVTPTCSHYRLNKHCSAITMNKTVVARNKSINRHGTNNINSARALQFQCE